MASFTKKELSGSTDGRQIKVAATSSPGTTIHTAVASTSTGVYDEIWLYATNSDTTDRKLTIQFGGTTSPDDEVEQVIPAEGGKIFVIPGEILQNALVVKAFCASANVVMIGGWINAIA